MLCSHRAAETPFAIPPSQSDQKKRNCISFEIFVWS